MWIKTLYSLPWKRVYQVVHFWPVLSVIWWIWMSLIERITGHDGWKRDDSWLLEKQIRCRGREKSGSVKPPSRVQGRKGIMWWNRSSQRRAQKVRSGSFRFIEVGGWKVLLCFGVEYGCKDEIGGCRDDYHWCGVITEKKKEGKGDFYYFERLHAALINAKKKLEEIEPSQRSWCFFKIQAVEVAASKITR